MAIRVLLYLRQSDTDGEGERSLSLDSQSRVLREDAKRLDWGIVAEIRDPDLKGYDDSRPGLLELYARCRSGDVDLVAFWSLDRLARSLRIQENVVWELDRLNVGMYSNQESWIGEPMFRQIMGSVNEHRTREIAGHVRRALRERTRRGVPHGSAPFGYSRGEGKVLTPNDDAATVQCIFQWRADGQSLGEIIAQLRQEGIPGPTGGAWHRPTLTHILSNPAYCGTLHLAEIEIPDAHPAIVDAEIWYRAQDVGSSRVRWPRTKATRSWLEGLIEHSCGAPMYLVGGSAGFPVPTFRCRVGGGWGRPDATCSARPRQIAAERAEALAWDAVTEVFARLPLSPKAIIKIAQAEYRQTMPEADAALKDAAVRQNKAIQRRERVLEAYLSGDVDRARFDAEMARADSALQNAELEIAQLPQPVDSAAIESTWSVLRDMRPALHEVPEEDRGLVLRKLGIAVVSPAGVPLITGRRGPRPDAGCVEIRFRHEYAILFRK